MSKVFHGDDPYGGSPIVPFNAEKSLMYILLTGGIEDQTQRMPYQKSSLSQIDISTIKDWINNGARDFNGNVPYSNGDKIYICNQGSDEVFEIDTDYKVVSRIISVDLTPTIIDAPHNVQIRNGFYYVTLIAAGRFLKINAATNEKVGEVSGIENAGMIQITKNGQTAFVSRSSTAPSIYNIIYAINTETMTIKQEISLPATGLPHAMWLTNDNTKLYVGNMTLDRISIIDVNTLEWEDDIVLPDDKTYEPMHLYVSPDDKYLYVNCRTSSSMLVIKLETKQIIQEIPIQDHPMQSAITEDGNKIYTVSHHEPIITEITKNGENWSITREYTSEAFHHLYGADISRDGKYLYVTCSNNDPDHQFEPHYKIPDVSRPSLVCIYDIALNEIVKIIDIGSFATGIATREN
jgi:DNA-binding beta-propeller fold protein YncE